MIYRAKFMYPGIVMSLLLASQILLAQPVPTETLTVHVIDSYTEQSLENAEVKLYRDGELIESAVTDATGGVEFTVDTSPTSIEETPLPEVQIFPAYPNPTPDFTSIPITLYRPSQITTVVFDLLGRRISFLQTDLNPGNHELQLDLSGQATGLYFLRLSDGSSVIGTVALVKSDSGGNRGPATFSTSGLAFPEHSDIGKASGSALIQWDIEVTKQGYLSVRRPFPVPSDEPYEIRLCVGHANTIGMEMIHIHSGTFEMGDLAGDGDSDEHPVHTVTFTRDFFIGRYEVTQEEYETVVGNNPSYNPENDRWPVENVSWYDAVRFANAMSGLEDYAPCYDDDGNVIGGGGNPYECEGYRLPMEAEWEYATRARTTTKFYFGDQITDVYVQYGSIHPVGERYQNPWGLYDVHGNVEEWTNDWYSSTYYENSPSVNPAGPSTGRRRVARRGIPSSDRSSWRRTDYWYDLGFRIARTVK